MNDDESYSSEFSFATDLNGKSVTTRKFERVGSLARHRSSFSSRAALNTPRK
jgi:hypothetical protein